MGINIYDVIPLEREIERIAEDNQGEIPDELLEALVKAETKTIAQVESLVKYIRHLELGIDACKAEEDRIATVRERADKRLQNIKKYLTPYVRYCRGVEAGTFKLSIRKSSRVITADNFDEKEYMRHTPERWDVDKKKIKADIKAGKEVAGASLIEAENLQIK